MEERSAKIVVIGASQGGVTGLRKLVAGLGSDFPAPVLVTLHIGAGNSILPELLAAADGLAAAFARNGDFLVPGRIYVAPPDQHMLVVDGFLELSRGPRENYARPAIDPLFRSAARAHGPDTIGIVLSGKLNDGTAGLIEIKRRGGTVIVQTPAEAEAPDMPRSALENVAVDYCLPIGDMPRLINRLVREPTEERSRAAGLATMEQYPPFQHPTAQTCPECGGAMREEQAGPLTRFRCHIGHVMTAEVVAALQLEVLTNGLSAALRRLNERAGLCSDLADKYSAAGNSAAAGRWQVAAGEAKGREAALTALVTLEWQHPENPPPTDRESDLEPVPLPAAANAGE